MGLSDFRRLFSKASVVVDNGRIIAVYSAKDIWVHQDTDDELTSFLSDVLRNSPEFLIRIEKGKRISFSFSGHFGVDTPVFYQPIEVQVDIGDLSAASDAISEPCPAFIEFMENHGANREVDAGFLADLLSFVRSKEPERFMSVDGFSRWKSFLSACQEFMSVSGASETRVTDYDEDFNGCIEFSFFDSDSPILYKGAEKDALVKAIRASSEMEFELNVVKGFLNITFFA